MLEAIAAVTAKAGADPSGVERFVHGMTVGDERAPRRARRPHGARHHERLRGRPRDRPPGPPGALPPLRSEAGAARRARRPRGRGRADRARRARSSRSRTPIPSGSPRTIAGLGAESVAISLLFSYVDPSHEERIASAIRERLARCPRLRVARGAAALPRVRAHVDDRDRRLPLSASRRLPGEAGGGAAEEGLPEPEIMRSSGGVAPWREAARPRCLERPLRARRGSGRRGPGREALRRRNAVGLDMGGTSCDVCVIEDGPSPLSESREIGGRVIQLPMVDVHTVGAGGGSIGWVDHGGALRVGPRSAGADLGPRATEGEETEPTVTDANLVLGRLRRGSNLAGDLELDAEAADRTRWPGSARSWASRRSRQPTGSCGSPTPRWSGRCASSPSTAGSIRGASRSCPSAAPARCTPPSSRRRWG